MGSAVARAEVGFRVSLAWLAGTLPGDGLDLVGVELFFGEALGLALDGVEVAESFDFEGDASSSTATGAVAFFAEDFGVEIEFPFLSGEGVLILVPEARA